MDNWAGNNRDTVVSRWFPDRQLKAFFDGAV